MHIFTATTYTYNTSCTFSAEWWFYHGRFLLDNQLTSIPSGVLSQLSNLQLLFATIADNYAKDLLDQWIIIHVLLVIATLCALLFEEIWGIVWIVTQPFGQCAEQQSTFDTGRRCIQWTRQFDNAVPASECPHGTACWSFRQPHQPYRFVSARAICGILWRVIVNLFQIFVSKQHNVAALRHIWWSRGPGLTVCESNLEKSILIIIFHGNCRDISRNQLTWVAADAFQGMFSLQVL